MYYDLQKVNAVNSKYKSKCKDFVFFFIYVAKKHLDQI